MEQLVFDLMVQQLRDFQTLTNNGEGKSNLKLTALKVELVRVENEIEKLLDTLTGANPTLLSYANSKIEQLDSERQRLSKDIADLSAEEVSPEAFVKIAEHLSNWDGVGFEDKRQVADEMTSTIVPTVGL